MQKVRFIVEEQLFLSGDNTINWKNILLVERLRTDGGNYAFAVLFSDEKSATYHQNSPAGKALLKHWEKYAPKLTERAERIPVG